MRSPIYDIIRGLWSNPEADLFKAHTRGTGHTNCVRTGSGSDRIEMRLRENAKDLVNSFS